MTYVASTIVPHGNYPTHDSQYGLGGYREVKTLKDRDSIPKERLREGSLVYVQREDIIYKYKDDSWLELVLDSLTEEDVERIIDKKETEFKVFYYKHLDDLTESDKIKSIDDLNGWTTKIPESSPIWLAIVTIYKREIIDAQYIKLTGEPGVDGSHVEYVYRQSKSSLPPSMFVDSQLSKNDGYIPPQWTDHPQGVTAEYKYEFVSTRVKINSIWLSFSTPVIWSKWGEDGRDGDGFEYIYSTSYDPNSSDRMDNPRNWEISQTNEYIYNTNLWLDNPSSNPDKVIEYVSTRKKEDGLWGRYSEPAIWYQKGKDGTDIDPILLVDAATEKLKADSEWLINYIQENGGSVAEAIVSPLEGSYTLVAGQTGEDATSGGLLTLSPGTTTLLNTTVAEKSSSIAGAALMTNKDNAIVSLQALYDGDTEDEEDPVRASITAIAEAEGSKVLIEAKETFISGDLIGNGNASFNGKVTASEFQTNITSNPNPLNMVMGNITLPDGDNTLVTQGALIFKLGDVNTAFFTVDPIDSTFKLFVRVQHDGTYKYEKIDFTKLFVGQEEVIELHPMYPEQFYYYDIPSVSPSPSHAPSPRRRAASLTLENAPLGIITLWNSYGTYFGTSEITSRTGPYVTPENRKIYTELNLDTSYFIVTLEGDNRAFIMDVPVYILKEVLINPSGEDVSPDNCIIFGPRITVILDPYNSSNISIKYYDNEYVFYKTNTVEVSDVILYDINLIPSVLKFQKDSMINELHFSELVEVFDLNRTINHEISKPCSNLYTVLLQEDNETPIISPTANGIEHESADLKISTIPYSYYSYQGWNRYYNEISMP